MNIEQLNSNEYNVYYQRYLDLVNKESGLSTTLESSAEACYNFFNNIPEEKHNFQYAAGKWTVKEVLMHLIDTERIFSYRGFRISRGDATPLANFDQSIYITHSHVKERKMVDLLNSYNLVRKATLDMIKYCKEEDLLRIGVASGNPMSARAALYLLPGHEQWHINIIKERYL